MFKYFKLSLIAIITFIITNLSLASDFKQVSASSNSYVNELEAIIGTEEYNSEIKRIINERFPSFDIPESEFSERVLDNSSYRILEITPNFDSTQVDLKYKGDLELNVEDIKSIYKNIITKKQITEPSFITNMPNFTLELMTLKQFVDYRGEFEGKYDAIVFSSGNYTKDQVNSCEIEFNDQDLFPTIISDDKYTYVGTVNANNQYHGLGTLYDKQTNKIIYVGTFNNGKYHGVGGKFYDENGEYIGGFKDGVRSCYGVSYDKNNKVIYHGQWANNKYHGYGTLYNSQQKIEYEGNFKNGEKWPGPLDDVLNDLTELKANQIIEEYVKKGIPVFISKDALSDPYSTIYKKFHALNNDYQNVFILDDETNDFDFYDTLSIMKITEILSEKPNIEFEQKPDDQTKPYSVNSPITFSFNLVNKDSAILEFYLDVNQDEVFSDAELVHATMIKRGHNSFSFSIPDVYTQILKYKIVVRDGNKSSLYDGSFKVSGKTADIKVLNIVSDNRELFPNELYNGDYNIIVDTCLAKDFKSNDNGNKNGKGKDWSCSHKTVMDKYDVIMLSQGIYNDSLNEPALRAIQEQLQNNKPFIFTSNVTKGHHKWMTYYRDYIGLTNYHTDIYQLNNKLEKLQIVNDSNYNLYPFNMYNEELAIPYLNPTSNEAYQLNLELDTVIPLMNMYNTNTMYDRFDSYNNYYFTKNNNVVYLNVGYDLSKQYKEVEKKLLINAIVNLYVENKAKEQEIEGNFFINVNNPFANQLIDINDNIEFSFNLIGKVSGSYNYLVKINGEDAFYGTLNNYEIKEISFNVNEYITLEELVEPLDVKIEVSSGQSETKSYVFTVYVTNLELYKVMEPTFTDYIFIPYGRSIDLRDKFIFSELVIRTLDFTIISNNELFQLDGYILTPKDVGNGKLNVSAEDILGNYYSYNFDVITYEPISEINLDDIIIAKNQTINLPFNVNTRSIQYSLVSGSNVVTITRDGNNLVLKGNNIGEGVYRFYGYDIFGHIVEKEITITVRYPNDIIFNTPIINVFIEDVITLDYFRNLITIYNNDYTISDVQFTSSNEDILSIEDEEVTLNNIGTVTVKASLPNGQETVIRVNIYNIIGNNTKFRDDLGAPVKIYTEITQYLKNYIILDPKNLPIDNLRMYFTITNINTGEVLVDNENLSEFVFTEAGNYRIEVRIEQYNNEGNLIKELNNISKNIIVYDKIDPNEDQGNNSH